MRSAVFQEPYVVATVDKPLPKVINPGDALVKVKFSGLCGSDLHYYRGHIPLKAGTTMGHEFVGSIVETGSAISETDFKVGEDVIATFTTQCGMCWYCQNGYSGICDDTVTFGKVGLDGGQAEYVLVPNAKSTLIKKPTSNEGVDDSVYVLMADIFVTGYFAVKKVLDHFDGKFRPEQISILQIGAGPVGLCAVRILKHFGFANIAVIDGLPDRLDAAKNLGANETVNFRSEDGKIEQLKDQMTDGRGFDAVLEIVGATSAMQTAFENVRRGGFICSVGMGHEALPFNALDAYAKGVTVSFGRCHAWSLFQEALEVFEKVKGGFEDFIEVKCSIEEAPEYYAKFERGEVKKVVFQFT